MATFVNDLRLTELATGEGSGTWGTTTNTNLELIAESFSFGTEAITTNADTHTTTIADGSTDPGRSLFLKYTGTLDSACTITIGPNTVSKLWFIENATSGSQNIIISQGSGADITIPNGQTKAIYSDGAGSGGAMVDAFQDLSIPDLFVDDDLTVGDDLILSSDSAIIKFGADADTTLTHTDGSGLTLNSTNKIMFNDASQFIQGSSATVLSLGATDEIDLTATAIDVNGTIDVSGNATLGGTLGVTGAVTANAGISIDNITIDGTEIDLSSGDLTIDVAGDIILDANGADVLLKDDGTQFGEFTNSSSDFVIKSSVSDKDMLFKGNDGGSEITALTLDMSAAGAATFNDKITAVGTSVFTNLDISGDIDVDGTTNLDVVDIDGAVDMASTLQVDGAITSSAGATITVADNSNTLTLVSTDADANSGPVLQLYRNSSSPADDDVLGEIEFDGENDADEQVQYGLIAAKIQDASDGTEDVRLSFKTIVAGTTRERITIQPAETVLNEDSVDLDFRVESDGSTHALFVQASDGNVGFNKSSPAMGIDLVAANNSQLRIDSSDTNDTTLFFDYNGGGATNRIRLRNAAGAFAINVDNTNEAMRIDSSGNLLVGKTATGGNTAGMQVVKGSFFSHVRDDGVVQVLNRKTSDGDLLQFEKDNSTVGSIGVNSSRLLIQSNGGSGLRFDGSSYTPFASGSASDGGVDLGFSGGRFKDLHLSGVAKADTYQFAQNSSASGATEAIYRPTTGEMAFKVNSQERARIDSTGNLLVGKTTTAFGTAGVRIDPSNIQVTTTNGTPIFVNRKDTDGNLIEFYNDAVLAGAITVAGTTVTYSPFMGSHYSETEDSDILFGTVMETVGSLVTNHYAEQSRLPKVKISTTEDSKAVYGVWIGSYNVDTPDADEDSTDPGETIAALGASWVRVRKDEQIELGDLLCSAGDGTAKVQDDDIIRSKTIGKVTSLEIKETHADGSFVVPAVLYCG